MIVTLTPNPSIDRTITLAGPLVRGAVQRVDTTTDQAGGKGINISRAAVTAGLPTRAILPARDGDPFVTGLGAAGITLEYPVLRHANNLESVLTYEGTSEVHQLVIGQALTGQAAFR